MAFTNKQKDALNTITAALADFPMRDRRQMVEWAMLITYGSFTIDNACETTWSRRGTMHEIMFPNP